MIPGCRLKIPALPKAGAYFQCCCGCGVGLSYSSGSLAQELPYATGVAIKRKKKKKKAGYIYEKLGKITLLFFLEKYLITPKHAETNTPKNSR